MIYLKEGRTPLNFAYNDEIVHNGNSTYQLSFKFPTNNPLWEELVEETLLLADDLHGEQEFIIFEVEKHHAYITVHANQVATLLNNYSITELSVNNASGDRVMRSLVGSIIREHKFTFSSDISSVHSINIKNVTVATALFKDKHSILGQWGGDLVRDKYDIRLLSNGGTNKEALFMYKKNLKSYQQKKSIKDLRTRIHFTKTISSQKEGEKDKVIAVTVDSPLIGKYKNIYEGNLDVSDQDVVDEVTLRKYGEQYFKSTLCDVIEENIEIDVVGNPDVPVRIFDIVTIFHEKFNLDVKKKITKYIFTPMGRKLKTIGFGKIQQGLGTTLASMIDDAVMEHVESKVDAFKIQKNLSELLKLDRKGIEDKLVDLEEKSNSALEVKRALFEADGTIPDVVKTKILDAVEAEVGRLKTIITEAELIKAIQAKLNYAEIKNVLIDKAFINQIISDEKFTQQFEDGEVTTQNIFTKLKDNIKSNISKEFVTKEGVKKLVNDLTIDADGIRQITQQESSRVFENKKSQLQGINSYIHKKYSDYSDGRNMSDNSTLKYIGIYTGDKATAPTNASEYSWTKLKSDGKLYKAYSNSLNGLDFTLVEPEENAKLFAKNRPRVNIVNDNDISDIWQANMFLSFKPNTKYTLTARAKGNNNKLWAYFRNNKTNDQYNWGQLEFRGLETKSITFTTTSNVDDVLFKFVLVPEDEDWTGVQIDWFTIYEGEKRYSDYPVNEPAQYHKYRYFGYVFKEGEPIASDFDWFDLQQTSIANDKYTHIVYSDNDDGSNFGREPKKYMGVARTTSPVQPTDKTAYKWFKVKGEDGRDGVDGKSINENLLPNSNFNQGFAKWEDKLTNSGLTHNFDHANTNFGRGLHIYGTANADYKGLSSAPFNLVAKQGDKLSLSMDLGKDALTQNAPLSLGLHYIDDKGVNVAQEWQTLDLATQNFEVRKYKRISRVFTIGKDIRKCRVMIYANPRQLINFYIDNIKLERGEVATDWSPAYEDLRGRDGASNYIHRKYSDNSNGANMSDNSNLKYIGIYTGTSPTPPTTASSYLWSKIKGEDGANGVPGVKGADGRTPYFHTAYANSPTGDRDFSTTNSSNKLYIGTYSDFEIADSTDFRKYKWVKIKGEDGRNGINGRDGVSNYIHRKYSDYSNGSNMSDNSNLKYIGIYTGTSSTPPTTASSYLWSKIKGEDGVNGVPGAKGADGRTPYFHTAYANSPTGDRDFSTTNSSNKLYIGTYSDFEVADSTDYRKYKWVKIKGEDGRNGINGRDGVSSYIYRKYSDNANGTPMSDDSNLKYIGIYTGTSATAPTTPSAYTWSKIKGEDGRQGVPGARGSDGRTSYLHTAYANSATGDRDFSTTNSNGKEYIGTYTDFEINDSNDYRRYKWVKIKGENGRDGKSINENLLPNSNFNQGFAKWEDKLTNSGLTHNFDHANTNFGRGLHIYGTANADYKGLSTVPFNLVAKQGDKLSLSMDLGKDALTNNSPLKLGIHYIDDKDVIVEQEWQTLDLATQNFEVKKYKRISRVFTVRKDIRKCRVMIYATSGQLINFYIDNIKLERGEVATEWSPAYEDLQGHTLTANLRLEGTYINNVTNNVKGYLDVFYDGQKITSGFNARIKFKGGILDTWSNFWNAKVDNTGLITNLSWGDKVQQYPIALDVIVLVTYKDSNTVANARLENVPDIVEIKEVVKKYKTFESTLEGFTSVVGEINTKILTRQQIKQNLNSEDVEKTGNDLYFNTKENLVANEYYTILADLDNVPANQQAYIYSASDGGDKKTIQNGLNYWVVKYPSNQTKINLYPLGANTKVKNVKIYKGDFRIKKDAAQENLYRDFGHEDTGFLHLMLNKNKINGNVYTVKFDASNFSNGAKWDVYNRIGYNQENLTQFFKTKGNEFTFTINDNTTADRMYLRIAPGTMPDISNVEIYDVSTEYVKNSQVSKLESSIMQTKNEIDLKVNKDDVIASINASVETNENGQNQGIVKIKGEVLADNIHGKTFTGSKFEVGKSGFLDSQGNNLRISAPHDWNGNSGVGMQLRGKTEGEFNQGLNIYRVNDVRDPNTPLYTPDETALTVFGEIRGAFKINTKPKSGSLKSRMGIAVMTNVSYNNPTYADGYAGGLYPVRSIYLKSGGGPTQIWVNDGTGSNSTYGVNVQNMESDINLKENISITNHSGLDVINKFTFHSFDWKEDKFGYRKPHTRIGLIAQEVREIQEDLVYENPNALALDDFRLLNVSLKAIQELSQENTNLKSQLKEMNERLTKLEGKINGNL